MVVFTKLIIFLLLINISILSCKLLSLIEKKFLKKGQNKIVISFDTWGLKVFKTVRTALLCIGSLEATWFGVFRLDIFLTGISLYMIGIGLRFIAVNTLGYYWNYNIVLFENHKLVQKGIYRYIHHPGYLGNVYLVGIFLCMNSMITVILAILFVIIFYIYRTKIENEIFYSRRKLYDKLEILPRYFKQGI